MNKFFIYLFFFILLINCSLSKKETSNQNEDIKIIFQKLKPIEKELNPNLNIQLQKLTKGKPFLRNNTNKKEAKKQLPKVISLLDKLVKKNIIHLNKASNLKSKLEKHVASL